MRRFVIALVALVLITIVLTSCGTEPVEGNDHTPVDISKIEKVAIPGDDDIQVYDVSLRDGTRCVITDGYQSGGVSCNFDSP